MGESDQFFGVGDLGSAQPSELSDRVWIIECYDEFPEELLAEFVEEHPELEIKHMVILVDNISERPM